MSPRDSEYWPARPQAPQRSQREREPRMLICARCKSEMWICKSCDRGHKYCCLACSQEARRAQQREASRCYRQTERGRQNARERQARFRRRRKTAEGRVTQQGVAFDGRARERYCRPARRRCVVCGARRSPGFRAVLRP